MMLWEYLFPQGLITASISTLQKCILIHTTCLASILTCAFQPEKFAF